MSLPSSEDVVDIFSFYEPPIDVGVTSTRIYQDTQLLIHGEIKYGGKRAGTFSVSFTDDPRTVHFRSIKLKPAFQNRGISDAWRQHFREKFIEHGVTLWFGHVVGPAAYAWATQPHIRWDEEAAQTAKEKIQHHLDTIQLSKTVQETGESLLKNEDLRPYQVAEWGRPEIYKASTTWPGKEVLLDMHWRLEVRAADVPLSV